MIWFCENCKELKKYADSEMGLCPRCGLAMARWIGDKSREQVEFDMMLTALMYGKKP